MRRLAVVTTALLTAGCTATPDPVPTPAPTPAPTCPASHRLSAPEQQGAGDRVTLWALFFAPEVVVNREVKIVWRMTGSGDFTMTATGPEDVSVEPSWGPLEHSGSSFRKPGQEWGTAWVFPASGCWTFTATRGADSARLTIRVG